MNVLLGMDGSELAFEALDETLGRAAETGDDLTVAIFHHEDADGIERRVRERLTDASLAVPIRHLTEQPASELVTLAESEGFDRIVIPGGSRSPLGKIRLDDTIEFVLLNADTTVTLYR